MPSHSQALIKRRRSAEERCRNLRIRPTLHLDEPLVRQFLEQSQQIMFTTLGFHLVLLQDNISNVVYGSGLLKQVPDPGPDGVKPIVNPSFKMKDDGFVFQVSGNLLLSCYYESTQGNIHLLHSHNLKSKLISAEWYHI